MPSERIRDLFRRYYPNPGREERLFRQRLGESAQGARRGLDFGCGSGALCDHDFRNDVDFVVGVDADPASAGNPFVNAVVLANGTALPFREGSFGVVAARYVFEHLDDPRAILRELARVLVPGGRIVFLTPNLWHYVTLIAWLTPAWVHRAAKRRHGVEHGDVFHTHYRANTESALRRLASETGYQVVSLEFVEASPNYLEFSRLLYRCGVAYERIVSRWDALRMFRVNLVVTLERL
ncbi:MAG: class I SAM-dependent methyltransferase [Vicinamibacterales bacterium]